MDEVTQAFSVLLKSICSEIWSRQGQNLAELVSLGHFDGALSWKIFHEYKSWGLLHLLVLSGSQYEAFSKAWLSLVQGMQRLFFKESNPLLAKMLLIPASWIYLSALKMPPPLLRCALLYWGYQFLTPLKFEKFTVIFLIFILHLFFIENLAPSDSAFLSWLAYLVLLSVNQLLKSQTLRTLTITLILSVTICLLKDLPLSLIALLMAGISNYFALPLFEKVLFPVVGYLSALSLILCPLLLLGISPNIFKGFLSTPLSLILDLALCPVLVANSAFRYTFSK